MQQHQGEEPGRLPVRRALARPVRPIDTRAPPNPSSGVAINPYTAPDAQASGALWRHRLEQAIKHSKRADHTPTVLIMDLDRFKEVNDTLGHPAGDAVHDDAEALRCHVLFLASN